MSRRTAARPLRGTVRVPGDKSISHRALLLAALADGRSRVDGVNPGADVAATAAAVRAVGATVASVDSDAVVEVEGCGGRGLQEPVAVVDAGNSGSTIRMGLGVFARVDGLTVVTGDASLRARPMLRVVAPLRRMGASIDGRCRGDRAPLSVRGGRLRGADVQLDVASAQVKSALLLAALGAEGTTSVAEPRRSRDHTERMLRAAGVDVRVAGTTVALDGPQPVPALDRRVPGDVSAAMFLAVAAAIVPGSHLTIEAVGLNPTRAAALDVLRSMGARVDVEISGDEGGEPVGDVTVEASELRGVDVGPDLVPSLVDEIPALAIAASRADGVTRFHGASELRVKESDRIAALVGGLRALGADAEELPDGLVVRGPAELGDGVVDSRGDHRIAMAFAVAGVASPQRIRVTRWDCVETSFPGFLDVVAAAQGRS
ncbi:MAG TPA: 3-phosphoshikimate 1-carboxyvinyltransferase [Actinomycetota bacterium]|nr:3-phosphoshikimate 1-carboxyvinyltransferase [Actinomycetota bacterium]